jgi:cell division protein FtsL
MNKKIVEKKQRRLGMVEKVLYVVEVIVTPLSFQTPLSPFVYFFL